MNKSMLTTTALAALLATSAFAQEATDPAVDPAAPAAEAPANGAAPEVADPAVLPEPTAEADVETGVADPAAESAETTVDDPAALPTAETAMDGEMEMDGYAPVDLAMVSTERLIGADIVTFDNEKVASIDDVIITDTGEVESLVAQFGGFLGFGSDKVLLTMDDVEVMQDESESLVIRTQLTPESIETRPAYEG